MALGGFLSRGNFMRKLTFSAFMMSAPTQRQVTGLAGGDILSAELAPALWRGEATVSPMPYDLAAEIAGVLDHLRVPGNAFRVYHPRRDGPAYDPDASIVSGLSPTISAWDTANSTITIAGLTNGYVISPGDMISWEYGSNPTRYALHRFTEGATVSGGTTGALQVFPQIRGTIAGGTAVEFNQPYCKAILVPGGVSDGAFDAVSMHTNGVKFQFMQTLR